MEPIREEEQGKRLLPQEQETQEEQPTQEEGPAPGTYYYFDCLDGTIGGELLTPAEISARLYGQDRGLTEPDLKRIAADYEAELHKYILTGGAEARHEQLTRLSW